MISDVSVREPQDDLLRRVMEGGRQSTEPYPEKHNRVSGSVRNKLCILANLGVSTSGFEPRRESWKSRRLRELEGWRRKCIRNSIALRASRVSQGIEQYISSGGWKIRETDQSPRDAYPPRLISFTIGPSAQVSLSFSIRPRRRKYSGKSERHMDCEVTANARRSSWFIWVEIIRSSSAGMSSIPL